MSIPLQRKLRLSLGAVAAGWLALIVFWDAAPFALSFDDAYYYFTIAQNWADGHPSTFGLIDRTNGYHPLWQLICVIPFSLGIKGTAAVRTLLALQLVGWLFAWYLLISKLGTAIENWPELAAGRAARRWTEAAMVVVAVAFAANPFVFKMVVNGLESGLVVVVSATLLWFVTGFGGRFVTQATTTQRYLLGALLSVAVLSRTDSLLLVATIVAAVLLERSGRRSEKPKLRLRVVAVFEIVVLPVLITGLYLASNQIFFGTLSQISGSIKRLPLTGTKIMLTLVWAAVGLGVLLGSRRSIPAKSRLLGMRRFFASTGWYAAFCVGLVGYYSTLQAVPYLWYFAPLGLYATWLGMLMAVDLVAGGLAESPPSAEGRVKAAAFLPVAIVALPLVVAAGFSFRSLTDPGLRSLLVHDAAAGEWISEHLPPEAVVASWDSGAIGFFAHRPMVNLDGVVNTPEWSQAMSNGTTAAFLEQRNVGWVANHGSYVDGQEPGIKETLRRYFGEAATQNVTTVHVESYRYTGTLDGSRADRSTKTMATFVYRLDR